MERTLIILKPDAVQRRLAGRIISRFEDKGFTIAGLKLLHLDEERARDLYSVHEDKPFYESLVGFITSAPIVAMVVEGSRAVKVCRKMLGATFGYDADPGTIRGDFGLSNQFNLVHGSDSAESADREIRIFFSEEEIVSYRLADGKWLEDE